MLWVALDRGVRLAEKRCLPCPNRGKWLAARDAVYEEVMEKGNLTTLLFTLPLSLAYPRYPD